MNDRLHHFHSDHEHQDVDTPRERMLDAFNADGGAWDDTDTTDDTDD